jgi:hypothetical protein
MSDRKAFKPLPQTFEMSTETRRLYEMLLATGIGELITYARLSAELGRTIGGGDHHLQAARNRALKLDGAVFQNLPRIGYRRLNDEQIVATAPETRLRLRREIRRGARIMACVSEFDRLPNRAKIEHNAQLSILGALGAALKPEAVKRVEDGVRRVQKSLPVAETLQAFGI